MLILGLFSFVVLSLGIVIFSEFCAMIHEFMNWKLIIYMCWENGYYTLRNKILDASYV